MSRYLSEHITLDDFTFSHVAIVHQIVNKPDFDQICNMQKLCTNLLEPLMAHIQKRIEIVSGFRVKELNEKLLGIPNSLHLTGSAVDIRVNRMSTLELAKLISVHLPYDLMIAECVNDEDPFSGWVHLTYSEEQRKRYLWKERKEI